MVDKIVNEAMNGGTVGAKVIRYIILFGWVVAGILFITLITQVLEGQQTLALNQVSLQKSVVEIRTDFLAYKTNMAREHDRIDRCIEGLDARMRRSK